jgi:hypothetical protein
MKYTFVKLNIYAFLVASLVSLDRLLHGGYPEADMIKKVVSAFFKLV